MTLAMEKPDVLERLGSAMGSSDLSPHLDKPAATDLLAALAMVQLRAGEDVPGGFSSWTIDPRTELGGVLLRLKIGGDRSVENRALHMLVRWLLHQRACRGWKLKPGQGSIIERFARQGLREWLYPTCDACHGRQMLGLDRGEIVERRIRCTRCRGQGWLTETEKKVTRDCVRCGGSGARKLVKVRKSKPEHCLRCGGTGQRRITVAERAAALGLDVKTCERHWEKRFAWIERSFDWINHLLKRQLQSQLRSDKNPAASDQSIDSTLAPRSVGRVRQPQGPSGT